MTKKSSSQSSIAEFSFADVARLPLPGDNVAVLIRRLPAGSVIVRGDQHLTLSHTVMEGHRVAVRPIEAGEALLSWEMPFGFATRRIEPGEYVCNQSMLDALSIRTLDFTLPSEPNFFHQYIPYQLDESKLNVCEQLPRYPNPRTFLGYRRSAERGVGTRNVIALIGTTSRTAGFVRQLEARFKGVAAHYINIDSIVALAHTEGEHPNPNNTEFVLRTLAGFMVHANVGAVLAIDYGNEAITNAMLQAYLQEHKYPIDELPHAFLSVTGNFNHELDQAEGIVRGWLDTVNATPRTAESLAHLRIALQCGGSDAFSGISANPLLGWIGREVVRYGGSANLAETDELIGAESYVLAKVREVSLAHKFLATMARFKEQVEWHGASAEGNPSGGNKFRGLYNITLKSIGAAMKKDPALRLDYVIDYAERMGVGGFYFMDSPGNDLEGIAGQVAAGCNLIIFTTGNGSITNFPFVPTIKIVTTTTRYNLLEDDMDINAGAYLDGVPMDELGAQALDYTVEVVSGRLSVGERAGHSQVQLWRNWPQTGAQDFRQVPIIQQRPGIPLSISQSPNRSTEAHERLPISARLSSPNAQSLLAPQPQLIGLILPTSLCAGQIAQMAARRLNQKQQTGEGGLRFVALSHTEGCGSSFSPERIYPRTMVGYMTHPSVNQCLMLEHGCEVTHNDFMREQMRQAGLDMDEYGWASIQLDGGIEKVLGKIENWFRQQAKAGDALNEERRGGGLRVGLAANGPISGAAAGALAQVVQGIVGGGGTVIVPANTALLQQPAFAAQLGLSDPQPTLAFAQSITQPGSQPGFHIMDCPTQHWVETLVGMGACGVELFIGYAGSQPLLGHPLIPLLQVTASAEVAERYGNDLDWVWQGSSDNWAGELLGLANRLLGHDYTAVADTLGNVDFQMTRGLLAVSL